MDQLSPEIRNAEKEIDNEYRSNLLTKQPFAVAAWYLLACCEDKFLFSALKKPNRSMFEIGAMTDNLVVELQYSLGWLKVSCPSGGKIPQTINQELYDAACELAELASEYPPYVAAFTYGSRGMIDLDINDVTISTKQNLSKDYRFEAYGRLIREEALKENDFRDKTLEMIERAVTVSETSFSYKLGKRLLSQTMRSLAQVYDYVFELPDEWEFISYTLEDFRRMTRYLMAVSFIHFIARFIAAAKGCEALGLSNCVICKTKDNLVWDISRYSNVKFYVASRFIDDLTYGEREIKYPDPALQPLIKINENDFIIMPSLLISNSLERNFTVLINRIPAERDLYSRLVQNKESVMRERIQERICVAGLRFYSGNSGLGKDVPDVDIAIISDDEKIVIIAELKWFIEPSEPREVVEKSKEIEKGITQSLILRNKYYENPAKLNSLLEIDDTYKPYFLVLSENFIGFDLSQHPEIPVVNAAHFIKKVNLEGNITRVIKWLNHRDYLPVEGKDYELFEGIWSVGKWKLKWYGIRPLAVDEFE